MSQHQIRQGRLADAQSLGEILDRARKDIPLKSHVMTEDCINFMQIACKQRRIWVIEESGTVAAFMTLNAGDIHYLVTDNYRRRCGYARSLIARAKRRVIYRQWESLTAKIQCENEIMKMLLTSEGFGIQPCGDPDWVHYVWHRRQFAQETSAHILDGADLALSDPAQQEF